MFSTQTPLPNSSIPHEIFLSRLTLDLQFQLIPPSKKQITWNLERCFPSSNKPSSSKLFMSSCRSLLWSAYARGSTPWFKWKWCQEVINTKFLLVFETETTRPCLKKKSTAGSVLKFSTSTGLAKHRTTSCVQVLRESQRMHRPWGTVVAARNLSPRLTVFVVPKTRSPEDSRSRGAEAWRLEDPRPRGLAHGPENGSDF